MYSVVLMMAMTSGTAAPDCHRTACCTPCYVNPCPVIVVPCGCCGGCYGCCGGCCGGCYGGCCGAPYYYPSPAGSTPKPGPAVQTKASVPAPAVIVVSLPADAKLTIDDASTKSTSELRTFVSPALNPGTNYLYTLRAEITRNGKPVIVEEKVQVLAGEETRVTLSPPTSLAAR